MIKVSNKKLGDWLVKKCYCGMLNNPKWQELGAPQLCIYCKIASEMVADGVIECFGVEK